MSVKEQAILDIKSELKRVGKSFIAFRTKLNPIMKELVRQQIQQQTEYSLWQLSKRKSHSQLMAHCFFSKSTGTANLTDFTKYYDKVQEGSDNNCRR